MTHPVDVHMRETDAFSWSMESDPRLRMTVVAVAVLDGAPDWAEVARRLERVTRAVPMFRQRVMPTPGHLASPKWVVDPRFDLDWHIRRIVAAPPATVESVLDFAAHVGSAAFDPARPMWEVWCVDGLASGGSALVAKVHHTLTDGLGGVQLLAHLFDVDGTPLATGPVGAPAPPGDPAAAARVRSALAHNAGRALAAGRGGRDAVARTLTAARTDPLGAVSGAVATWRSLLETLAPTGDQLSPVMVQRGLRRRYGALDLPLERLRAAGHLVGGTVNDAFVAGITGGLRRYHALHGAVVAELRMTLPISIRRPGDPTAGNRIALIRFLVPVGVSDPVTRMAEIRRRCERWKTAPGLPYTEAAYGLVNWLPTSYLQGLATHVDFVASNVPGFAVPVRLAGPRLVALYPYSPTGGTAVNVTMMSCADTAHIGVNTDVDAVPDLDAFLTCLRAGFAEVTDAAPRHRHRPADRKAAARAVVG